MVLLLNMANKYRLKFISFLFALGCVACTNPPYRGKEVVGADTFVLDSYLIREGKFAILEMEGKMAEPLPEALLAEYSDTIQEGDVLKIALYHPTRGDLASAVGAISESIGYRVNRGEITLPELGSFYVAELSLEGARFAIQKAYDRQIRDAQVFVAYRQRIEKKVELAGKVALYEVPVDGKLRLFETLAKAQVPPSANLFKSYLVREGHPLSVDFNRLLKEGDMTQNIVMRGGDKIYIAEENSANLMVMGEVAKPGTLPLLSGAMPLREALAQAGGILFTGDKAFIQVIRGNILRPKIYTLNWEHVVRLPTDSLLLMPGDIVYVAATPISEWNRFVSQLFPSFTALDLFCRTGIVAIP